MAGDYFYSLNPMYVFNSMSLKPKNNIVLKSIMKRYTLLSLILFFGFSQTDAQLTRRDSLEKRIEDYRTEQNFNPQDSLYIDLLNNLGSEMRYFKTDSLLLLSQKAFKLSMAAKNDFGCVLMMLS